MKFSIDLADSYILYILGLGLLYPEEAIFIWKLKRMGDYSYPSNI